MKYTEVCSMMKRGAINWDPLSWGSRQLNNVYQGVKSGVNSLTTPKTTPGLEAVTLPQTPQQRQKYLAQKAAREGKVRIKDPATGQMVQLTPPQQYLQKPYQDAQWGEFKGVVNPQYTEFQNMLSKMRAGDRGALSQWQGAQRKRQRDLQNQYRQEAQQRDAQKAAYNAKIKQLQDRDKASMDKIRQPVQSPAVTYAEVRKQMANAYDVSSGASSQQGLASSPAQRAKKIREYLANRQKALSAAPTQQQLAQRARDQQKQRQYWADLRNKNQLSRKQAPDQVQQSAAIQVKQIPATAAEKKEAPVMQTAYPAQEPYKAADGITYDSKDQYDAIYGPKVNSGYQNVVTTKTKGGGTIRNYSGRNIYDTQRRQLADIRQNALNRASQI